MTVAIMNPGIKNECFVPYNKSELKKCVTMLLSSGRAHKFIMTCFNEDAVEVMRELKNDNAPIEFFIINIYRDYDKSLAEHYIPLGGYECTDAVAISDSFNEYFFENFDLHIYPTPNSVTVQENKANTLQ